MGRPKSDNPRNIRIVFTVNEQENDFIEGVAEGLEVSKPEAMRTFISFVSSIDPQKIVTYYDRIKLEPETEKISTFDLILENKLEKKEMPKKVEQETEEINGLDDVTRRFEKIEKELDNIKYIVDNNSDSIIEIVEVVDDIIKAHNKLYNTFRSHTHLLGNIVAEIDNDEEEDYEEEDEENDCDDEESDDEESDDEE